MQHSTFDYQNLCKLLFLNDCMIIGLTGPNCAGKTTIAELLKKRGWTAWSLSDAVRNEAKRRGLGEDRNTLIKLANQMREQQGGGIFGKKMGERIREARTLNPKQHFVIDSVRSPLEVEELKKLPEFQLWCVDAPLKLRFERALQRGRLESASTLEEFKAKETEEDTDDPNKQQLGNTFKQADKHIQNIGTREALQEKITTSCNNFL